MSSEYWKVLLLKFFSLPYNLGAQATKIHTFSTSLLFLGWAEASRDPLELYLHAATKFKIMFTKLNEFFFFLHFGQKFKFQFFKLTITTLNFRAKFDLDFTHWVKNQNWPVFWRQNSKLSQYHYFAKYGAKIQMWKSGI